MNVGTGEITTASTPETPLEKNALSHDVKFEVVTSGNITPAWKLVQASVNQGGTFFSARRDRTHELLVTFGPSDPAAKSLLGPASQEFLAAQIGIAISNRVINALTP